MKFNNHPRDNIVLIKGAGEKASAVAHHLYQASLRKIVMTDLVKPRAERRGVSFCEAIIDGRKEVCGVVSQRVDSSIEMIHHCWAEGMIPILADPKIEILGVLKPQIFIDAVMAKKNTGTTIHCAPLVIALGPGFTTGKDAHLVVETNPHSRLLGRMISTGQADENSGIPTSIAGFTVERIIESPANGILHSLRDIGDEVKENEVIAYVNRRNLKANMSGIIWGLVRNGVKVKVGQKIGDLDPRGEKKFCFEITPQATIIAGGVREGIFRSIKF